MNDVRLFYRGQPETYLPESHFDVQLSTQTDESEMLLVAGLVVEGEQIDLVGLDRIVDPDTGEVSYNVGIWFDHPSDYEGEWRAIYTIDADMVQRRLAARQSLPGADEGPFQSPYPIAPGGAT